MASSLEFNKVAAAVLTAGVIASASGVLSRILYHPSLPEEPAYQVDILAGDAVAEDDGGGETMTLAALLVEGDPAGGASVAKKCAACHSFEEGGPNKIGPVLYGVLDRDIASVEGFAYSDALTSLEGNWDYDALGAFVSDPKGYAPGTKMAFAGVKKPQDLGDLILYLRSLGDAETPLPEPPAAAAEAEATQEAEVAEEAAAASSDGAPTGEAAAVVEAGEAEAATDQATEPEATEPDAAAAAEGDAAAVEGEASTEVAAVAADADVATAGDTAAASGSGLGALLAAADLEAGAKSARKCKTCHTFEADGGNRLGPGLWNVVGRDIAGVDGFKYSEVLAGMDGDWSYEALDTYLTDPKAFAPGNKMAFAGLKKPEERAAVIAYLRTLADQPAPLP